MIIKIKGGSKKVAQLIFSPRRDFHETLVLIRQLLYYSDTLFGLAVPEVHITETSKEIIYTAGESVLKKFQAIAQKSLSIGGKLITDKELQEKALKQKDTT